MDTILTAKSFDNPALNKYLGHTKFKDKWSGTENSAIARLTSLMEGAATDKLGRVADDQGGSFQRSWSRRSTTKGAVLAFVNDCENHFSGRGLNGASVREFILAYFFGEEYEESKSLNYKDIDVGKCREMLKMLSETAQVLPTLNNAARNDCPVSEPSCRGNEGCHDIQIQESSGGNNVERNEGQVPESSGGSNAVQDENLAQFDFNAVDLIKLVEERFNLSEDQKTQIHNNIGKIKKRLEGSLSDEKISKDFIDSTKTLMKSGDKYIVCFLQEAIEGELGLAKLELRDYGNSKMLPRDNLEVRNGVVESSEERDGKKFTKYAYNEVELVKGKDVMMAQNNNTCFMIAPMNGLIKQNMEKFLLVKSKVEAAYNKIPIGKRFYSQIDGNDQNPNACLYSKFEAMLATLYKQKYSGFRKYEYDRSDDFLQKVLGVGCKRWVFTNSSDVRKINDFLQGGGLVTVGPKTGEMKNLHFMQVMRVDLDKNKIVVRESRSEAGDGKFSDVGDYEKDIRDFFRNEFLAAEWPRDEEGWKAWEAQFDKTWGLA